MNDNATSTNDCLEISKIFSMLVVDCTIWRIFFSYLSSMSL